RAARTSAPAATAVGWRVPRGIRATTRYHARHVLGPAAPQRTVDAVARACVRSNLYYYADFARFGTTEPEQVFDEFDSMIGIEHLFDAIDGERGVILVSAHLGGAEMLAQAAAPFGICLGIVTEPLSPPRLQAYVQQNRSARGVRFFPADRSGLRMSIGHLRAGGTLGLLVDRDVLGTAEPFPFFGERTRLPSGAVELARRTGAPMVAAWVPRTGPARYALHIEPVAMPPATGDRDADLESGMRAMVATLESGIRRWPGQWFPLAPVWGEDATPASSAAERPR
ncbi:MAG: lysophospholipid acyltransferase family protein, partial [Dehalococcoidia bacterium]